MICVWGFCAKVVGLTILDTDYDNEIYDNSKQQIKNRNIRERKYLNSDDGWVLKKGLQDCIKQNYENLSEMEKKAIF